MTFVIDTVGEITLPNGDKCRGVILTSEDPADIRAAARQWAGKVQLVSAREAQAHPIVSRWKYQGKSGVWDIRYDWPGVYLAQHDDITGDEDPAWMFAQGQTLIGVMDEIDAIEAENACTECHALVGDDLTEAAEGQHLCDDCLRTAIRREVEMAEMADDDRAHGVMERRAGL